MLQKTKKRLFVLIAGLVATAGTVTWLASAATPVRLYVSPAEQTAVANDSFSVAVRLYTPSTSVDYVRAYISYPADKLQVSSISAAGSAFSYQHEQSFDNTAGQIRLGRYSHGSAVNGDLLVATVTFQAKSSGDAVAAFQAASSVRLLSDAQQERLTETMPGQYKITGPAASSSSPAASVPNPSLSPNPNPAPVPSTPPATAIPPAQPSRSASESQSGQQGDDRPDGVTVPVKITILSRKREPVRDVQVTVDGLTQTTDHAGTVLFGLQPGVTVAQVKSGRTVKDFDITVEDTAAQQITLPGEQSFVFVLPQTGTVSAFFGGALVVPMGGLTAFIVSRRRKLQRIKVPVFGYAPATHLRKPRVQKQDPNLTLEVHPHQLAGASIIRAKHITALPKPSRPPAKKKQPAAILLPTKAKTIPVLPGGPPPPRAAPLAPLPTPPVSSPPAAVVQLPPAMPQPVAAPVASPPLAVPTIQEPLYPQPKGSKTPEWQLDIQRQLAKSRQAEKFEEPQDMFETADEQYHYDKKFGAVQPKTRIVKHIKHEPEDIKKASKKYLF